MTPLTADDFFETVPGTAPLFIDEHRLRVDFAMSVLRGEAAGVTDLEAADVTVRLLHSELEKYGTSGGHRIQKDEDLELLVRVARAACKRIGLDLPKLPFRGLNGFYGYWKKQGMSGSYAARRNYLEGVFGPLEDGIDRLQFNVIENSLADPISPRHKTGWPTVDGEIAELRRRFDVARTGQDYAAVGTACVRILEAVGDAAFDPTKHAAGGQPAPSRDQTKERFALVIGARLSGRDNEELRGLVNAAISVAHRVKHRSTPGRRDAGMAADSAILWRISFAASLSRSRSNGIAPHQNIPQVQSLFGVAIGRM